jgi:endonuclease I
MIILSLIFSIYTANSFAYDWDSSQKQINAEIEQKKLLNEQVLNYSFYCDCPAWDNYLYLKKCSYNIQNLSVAAKIRHIIPVSQFVDRFKEFKGNDKKCREKNPAVFGEECVSLVNKEYIQLESDPNNLSIVEPFINQSLAGKTISSTNIKGSYLNACPIKTNTQQIYFEDPKKAGWIARLFLYLDETYPTAKILNEEKRISYSKISDTYKPSKNECKFTLAISKKYGKINKRTQDLCMKQQKGGIHGSK